MYEKITCVTNKTFLLESVNVIHTVGKEHSVQVYIDKIVEILA